MDQSLTLPAPATIVKRPAPWFVVLFVLAANTWHGTARAKEIVNLEVAAGIRANAAHWGRGTARPAVVIVHGLYQTYSFPTVTRLAETLAEAGHSVLTPNLSLRVSDRRQSLACDAIHAHELGADSREIGVWVDWLRSRGHAEVVLIGHSFGSLNVLKFMEGKPQQGVSRLILLSLIDPRVETERPGFLALRGAASARMGRRAESLFRYRLSFCDRLVATPESFLSYADWTVADLLKLLSIPGVGVDVIMAGDDGRVGPDWAERLAAGGANATVIPGADHFFDASHEFELHDTVLSMLSGERN